MELLRPQDIARLKGLAVRAKAVADGVFSGRHRGLHQGASRDFSEHKEYTPGDDLRTLDWKAYARFDRPLVRRFESETERGCLILLDVSASMGYGDGPLCKLDWARVTAAALAYLLLGQQDRVGVGLLGTRFRLVLPPRARGDQLAAVIAALEAARLEPGPPGRLGDGLGESLEALPRRGLVAVFSDFLDPRPEVPAILRRLGTGRRELAAFQVLDPSEESFPFDGFCRFHSPELPEGDLTLDSGEVRRAYLERLQALRQGLRSAASEAGFAFLTATTETPPASLLIDWVSGRASQGRDPGGPSRASGAPSTPGAAARGVAAGARESP
ncbi:MAG: DUF58 domain-containing protein [Polyangia bacterium]|jgi:uncharacterized protein (DUF58 family)|nr:DUF58 domain-containing protein [Polyangia bacterium]